MRAEDAVLGLGRDGAEARVQAAQAAESGPVVRTAVGGSGQARRAEIVAEQVGLGVLGGRVVALEDQLVVVERRGGGEARVQLARDEVVQAGGDGGEGQERGRGEGPEDFEEDLGQGIRAGGVESGRVANLVWERVQRGGRKHCSGRGRLNWFVQQ